MTTEQKAKELAIRWEKNSMLTVYEALSEMSKWKDKQFWSYQNIEQIIKTYKSFSDRSCPSELIKKTIEKLKLKQ